MSGSQAFRCDHHGKTNRPNKHHQATRWGLAQVIKAALPVLCATVLCLGSPEAQAQNRPLIANPQQALAPAEMPPIDYVFVEKGKRQLSLWRDGWLVKSYTIRLGRTPEGDKTEQGDGRTPEGLYSIDFRKPDSSYHLALHISYPSPEDRTEAARRGVNPGGAIMIHGFPNDTDKALANRVHRYVDWTEGCIAMTNAEIEELWSLVPVGTPIEIVP